MSDLQKMRREIDVIDRQIVRLLGRRMRVVRRVAAFKRVHNTRVVDPRRMREVYRSRAALGKRYDLDRRIVKKLFTIIMESAIAYEKRFIRRGR